MCSFGVLKVCFAPFVVSVERVFCVPVGHYFEACAGGTLYSPPFIISVECVLGVSVFEEGERSCRCAVNLFSFIISVERVLGVSVFEDGERTCRCVVNLFSFIIYVECVLGVAMSEVGERVSACVFQFSSALKHFVVYYDVLAPVVSIVLFVPVVAAFLYGGCRSSVLGADVRGGGWQRY